MNDITLALTTLAAKNGPLTTLWNYYHGRHPVVFTNPKWNEVFPNTVPWTENLCQVVCDVPEKRMRVQSINTDGDSAQNLNDLWKRTLRKTSSPVHLAALVTGEAYLIAWKNAADKEKAYYHDPRQAHVFYEEEDPDAPRMACKKWATTDPETDKKIHWLNLYYADRLEHYAATGDAPEPGTYTLTEAGIEVNPYGVIPVFHFRVRPAQSCGALTGGVIAQQDQLNKLNNDMMVSSEYSAFAQRWAIGDFDEKSKIPIGPGIVTKFPAADASMQPTQVGAFPTTPPTQYLEPMDHCRSNIALMSDTPKHFLEATGGTPSGEALAAMEAPLIARVLGYEECLAETWVQAVAFCGQLQGLSVDPEDIEIIWVDPHTVQPESQARVRLINTQAGIPIANQLRDEGWDEDDIGKMFEDMTATTTASASPAAPSQGVTTKPVVAGAAQAAADATLAKLKENGALDKLIGQAQTAKADKAKVKA